MAGRKVTLPQYSFTRAARGGADGGPGVDNRDPEGIHGLNPSLVPGCRGARHHVYVSALTQLNLIGTMGEHHRLPADPRMCATPPNAATGAGHGKLGLGDPREGTSSLPGEQRRRLQLRTGTRAGGAGRWPSHCCCRCGPPPRSSWRRIACSPAVVPAGAARHGARQLDPEGVHRRLHPEGFRLWPTPTT